MKNLLWTISLILLFGAQPSLAERADRSKPINVEANSLTVDDERHAQILEGDVLLTQGTLTIRASKMIITEDAEGFQRGVATGGPKGKAYFRQKREGRTDFIEGEGERIEYNTRSEVAELFNQAWVKSGQDLIKSNYIWYDAVAEKYRANSTAPTDAQTNANASAPSGTGRVRAVLQPQNRKSDPSIEPTGASSNLPVLLQSSKQIEKH
jgi:lipopolysaccharide export system protein LptA